MNNMFNLSQKPAVYNRLFKPNDIIKIRFDNCAYLNIICTSDGLKICYDTATTATATAAALFMYRRQRRRIRHKHIG